MQVMRPYSSGWPILPILPGGHVQTSVICQCRMESWWCWRSSDAKGVRIGGGQDEEHRETRHRLIIVTGKKMV